VQRLPSRHLLAARYFEHVHSLCRRQRHRFDRQQLADGLRVFAWLHPRDDEQFLAQL
jgi:hypothetical protein